jgi:hypothetical protein
VDPTDPSTNPPPAPLEEPDDFKPMLIGAALIFVMSVVPYVSLLGCCCLPHIAGALLAVHLFTKWNRLTLTSGEAIKLGILTVLLGAMAAWAVAVAWQLIFGYQLNMKQVEALMLKIYSHFGPQFVDKAREAMEAQKQKGVTLSQLLIGLCATVVVSAISGLIGGALGAALFKRGPAKDQAS